MKEYAEYKDSGIQWIGEMPSEWGVKKLKFFSNIQSGDALTKEDYDDDGEYDVIGSNGPLGKYTKKNVNKAKIIIGRVGAVGSLNLFSDCWVNDNALILSNDNQVVQQYLLYCLSNVDFLSQSTGTAQPLMTGTQLKNTSIPYPKLIIQQNISDYLDHKTAAIDKLIENKQKLIDLLREKRQAIISEAVSKGLDKTAPMKESGIEWIGHMPKGWELKRIKFVFEIVKRLYYKEDRAVLSITQKGIRIRDTDSNDGQLAQSYAGYQLVHINDFAMNSMDLLTGFVDCSPYEGVTSPDYRVFRFAVRQEQSHEYYKHLFQMLYTNRIFYGFGQGVSNLGRWRLQTETFENFWVPVPPLNEQQQIAEFVVSQSQKIDNIIVTTQAQIEKLKEYRQSVISEAVTGKVAI